MSSPAHVDEGETTKDNPSEVVSELNNDIINQVVDKEKIDEPSNFPISDDTVTEKREEVLKEQEDPSKEISPPGKPAPERKEGVKVSLNIPLTTLTTTTTVSSSVVGTSKEIKRPLLQLPTMPPVVAPAVSKESSDLPSSSSQQSKQNTKSAFKLSSLNLQLSEAQIEALKRKQTESLAKAAAVKRSNSVEMEKTEDMEVGNPNDDGSQDSETLSVASSLLGLNPLSESLASGSPAKPRRSSSIQHGDSILAVGSPTERMRQDSGESNSGSSRKHRARKEKLICRSESPSTSDATLGSTSSLPVATQHVQSPGNFQAHQQNQGDALKHSATKPQHPTSRPVPKTTIKPREKRPNNGGNIRSGGSYRKNVPGAPNMPVKSRSSTNLKEPQLKKKKIIDILSPKKKKVNPMNIMKTSDTIFVRAANNNNKPFKMKMGSSSHKRLKFSRANLYKSGDIHRGMVSQSQTRIRRPSSNAIHGSTSKPPFSKQRSSVQKTEPEAESFSLPPAFVDDLMWLIEDAAKELNPNYNTANMTDTTTQGPSSSGIPNVTQLNDSDRSSQLLGNINLTGRIPFERRRVDSESSGISGFDGTPVSPSGSSISSQSFYHVRRDLYFSPSPSYITTGPGVARRRYSRRRHAKIHPPIEHTNCNFQGHFCHNPRVPHQQYCEKHFDQQRTNPPAHQCEYLKEGRKCSNMIPGFDPMMYCETHANQLARDQSELRNPKIPPDASKTIIAKIKQIKDGLDGMHNSILLPDILQILEQPEVVQEIPLGEYRGNLLEELDVEGERNINPDKPDYDSLKNAGYFTTEEVIQIHMSKVRKLKALNLRAKELLSRLRQGRHRQFKDNLEKLTRLGSKFTTNPYLINKKLDLPKEYIDHQIKEYEAAKAVLQFAYKSDGKRSLTKYKNLQRVQELARKAKASGLKQHDIADGYDSDTDEEFSGENADHRDRQEAGKLIGHKHYKCAYNEGYAVRACQNPPFYMLDYCAKHLLSDANLVPWIPCNKRIGSDAQDVCKVPGLRILDKHGCPLHKPLMMSKHKPLRKTEEELNLLVYSDDEEEEITLENESNELVNLVLDESVNTEHLDEEINHIVRRGPLELTDTSDSEETDEEGIAPLSSTNTENHNNFGNHFNGPT